MFSYMPRGPNFVTTTRPIRSQAAGSGRSGLGRRGGISPEPTECYHFGMSSELSTTSASRLQRAWRRISDWLGLDRSEPADLLETDPARHFQEWDRDLPDPYAG